MPESTPEPRTYTFRTLKWLAGNFAFGVAPLLLLIFFKLIPMKEINGKQVSTEIHNLFKNGIIFFVCVALTGAVVIDIWNSELKDKFKKNEFFFFVVSPFFVLGFVLIIYTLSVFQIADESYFSSFSWPNVGVISYSIIYCAVAKYRMFALEA